MTVGKTVVGKRTAVIGGVMITGEAMDGRIKTGIEADGVGD